jgi:hypothetical protein
MPGPCEQRERLNEGELHALRKIRGHVHTLMHLDGGFSTSGRANG